MWRQLLTIDIVPEKLKAELAKYMRAKKVSVKDFKKLTWIHFSTLEKCVKTKTMGYKTQIKFEDAWFILQDIVSKPSLWDDTEK